MEAIGESIFCYIPRLADAVEDDAASFLKLATLSNRLLPVPRPGHGLRRRRRQPFATSLYAMHCEGGDAAAGVTFGAAKGALGRAVTAKRVFDRVERQEWTTTALRLIGFGDVARVFQGQFVQGIFQRLDVDGDGEVRLPEFWSTPRGSCGPSPGKDPCATPRASRLGALVVDDGAEDIRHFVASLQTGDIILSKIDDDMGRYLQFAMDAPWSHVAVVVRGAAPAPGAPNEKTEELLETFPFRRRSHAFCSPGSCVCFPWSHEDAADGRAGFFGRQGGEELPGVHRGVLRDAEADLADGVALGPLEII
ncbi:hypothetical protein JL720_10672 [Aureococcus anophagefferens]|nr:hypothetical protein JL720_10672 [Aureococcus anophagefferens]